ncbi:BEM_collapsed_G0019910.mRNA.1.CDS.1 [Saccharomyces cerevisiae]|nr:BEM_collapsed_G0019910.mRNA.1.CDS.1 [Saccharomyces cerevisiae]
MFIIVIAKMMEMSSKNKPNKKNLKILRNMNLNLLNRRKDSMLRMKKRKGARANHNRKKGHDKKLARAGNNAI